MGNAAFHLSVEFPQLSKIPPQERIHGPLVPPCSPWGRGGDRDQSGQDVPTTGNLCSWNLGKLNWKCWGE